MSEPAQPIESKPAARVLVAGASGLTGALAARLVWEHPRLELVAATSRGEAGKRLDELHPRHRVPVVLAEPDLDSIECDAALVAYPHGASAPAVAALRSRGIKVVDLSADFRFSELATYEDAYGEHGAPDLFGHSVYGLTEFHREEIRGAELVANPGCYPTAALLALLPLEGMIERVAISAASGVSGAGRNKGEGTSFVNATENFGPYGIDGHRHSPEIRVGLRDIGFEGPLSFVPHLLPLDQGLLASCFVDLNRDLSAAGLHEIFAKRYAGEPFVELAEGNPGVRDVRESNRCLIRTAVDAESGRALVFAAIDNLWKGASGQAIQNLNLMVGLEEGEGL